MPELPTVERDGGTFYIRGGDEVLTYDKEGAIAVFLALGVALKEYDQDKTSNGRAEPDPV